MTRIRSTEIKNANERLIKRTINSFRKDISTTPLNGTVRAKSTVYKPTGTEICKCVNHVWEHNWDRVHFQSQPVDLNCISEEKIDWCDKCGSLRVTVENRKNN